MGIPMIIRTILALALLALSSAAYAQFGPQFTSCAGVLTPTHAVVVGSAPTQNCLADAGGAALIGNGTAPTTGQIPVGNSSGVYVPTTPTGSGAAQTVGFAPGPLTSITATIFGYARIKNASTVDYITGSTFTFTCTGNPTITIYECGTSTTCATPTTIGTVTLTASGTGTAGTVSSSAITAGDYIAGGVTAGTCAALDPAVNVSLHAN
jgi:hypothetical protein